MPFLVKSEERKDKRKGKKILRNAKSSCFLFFNVGAVLVPAREITCKARRAHTRGAPTLVKREK
jgi:hypothetical protein